MYRISEYIGSLCNVCYFLHRSIVWLQNMHDANLERNRGHAARRLEPQEIRIGRLKHERVKVPREEKEVSFHALNYTFSTFE